jgi:DNA-binding ferritin-like protein
MAKQPLKMPINMMSKMQAGGKLGGKSIKGEFVGMLLQSAVQTHVFHLMSSSYAQHKALGKFYEEIPDLVDSIAEILQGQEGKITSYPTTMTISNVYDPIGYLTDLRKKVETMRDAVSQSTNFMNQTDAILDLIDSTLYKLKELK